VPVKLMPLPYPVDALQPIMSAETMRIHHGKHHQSYVKKTNDATVGSTLADAPVEQIIAAAKRARNDTLFNNAAQVWNHGFYWHSLSPEPTRPSKPLSEAIVRQFGSLPKLRTSLVEAGMAHFGSGWVWLVRNGSTLKIVDTHDAETAVGQKWRPLFVIDLWEHAYYVDHRNEREAYLKTVTAKLINWQFASDNFESDALWTYA
jgi:superoxide dismutase, Fe-Mn family